MCCFAERKKRTCPAMTPRRSTNLLRLRLLSNQAAARLVYYPSSRSLAAFPSCIFLVSLHLLIGEINWLSEILNEPCGRQL
jgi:hypothetical protein